MEYCKNQLDITDDKLKELGHTLSDHESEISALQEDITATTGEIDTLEDGIVALDKSVAQATEQRKEENAEYTQLMAANGAAKELILFAKNRMQKFYNPKLYKAPPKRELTEEERITLNNGGTLAPTEAPGGIAGTGIGFFAQVAQTAAQNPVFAQAAYTKQDSGGALALMDLLVKDLTKEITIAEAEEKNSQADYEKMLKDSATKRAEDSKAVTDKKEALAQMQGELEAAKEAKASTEKDIATTNVYLASLHTECDFIMKFYTTRQEARVSEIDAMGNAKAVLSGA
jgi:septal ring factor EnvC (AmiA/AmiB activator)